MTQIGDLVVFKTDDPIKRWAKGDVGKVIAVHASEGLVSEGHYDEPRAQIRVGYVEFWVNPKQFEVMNKFGE